MANKTYDILLKTVALAVAMASVSCYWKHGPEYMSSPHEVSVKSVALKKSVDKQPIVNVAPVYVSERAVVLPRYCTLHHHRVLPPPPPPRPRCERVDPRRVLPPPPPMHGHFDYRYHGR